ncbi:MAG: hypothetical protein B7Z62_08590 [Deltaproteobacteria bacterium 37-65-8]|nr:MAG: hypothetical protein B7Z62_08590 [Deltaproteobacteria bacterium 37-65-8]
MANRHCAVKTGRTGAAAKHYDYIVGEGRYAEKGREEVILRSSGNMPEFAQENPGEFWKAADQFERKSHTSTKTNRETGEQFEKQIHGRAYKEVEFSIPREITDQAKQLQFAQEFAAQIVGLHHPYTLAVHNATAKDGLPNVNAHLMFSDRINDGAKRDAEVFFKRKASAYRDRKTKELIPADPAKGGAGKNREMNSRAWVQGVRQGFQEHARRYGVEIDMRSNKEQGLGDPEPKLGPAHPRVEHVPYREHKIEVVDAMRDARAEAEVARQDQERIAMRLQEQRDAKAKELERRKGALEKLAKRIQSGEVSIRKLGSEIESIGFVRRSDDPKKWVVEPALHEAFDAVLDTARKAVAESQAKRMETEAKRQAEARAQEAERSDSIRFFLDGVNYRDPQSFERNLDRIRKEAQKPDFSEIVAAQKRGWEQYGREATDVARRSWLESPDGLERQQKDLAAQLNSAKSGLFAWTRKKKAEDLAGQLSSVEMVIGERNAAGQASVRAFEQERKEAAERFEKVLPYLDEARESFNQGVAGRAEVDRRAASRQQERAEAQRQAGGAGTGEATR